MVMPPAFRSRPFLMYWIGHLISFMGSQMQLWAMYWQLRILTDQPLVISGIGLVRFLPVVLFSLFSGVVADRVDRRKMTIFTQFAQGFIAVILGLKTAQGEITLAILFSLVAIQTVAVVFDVPARQALIPSLVPREDLPSAYSLTSIASKVGGILGPVIAGLVIAYLGLEWTYWLNAISFLAVIAALVLMGNIKMEMEGKSFEFRRTFIDIREGIDFILNSPIILSAMILDFFGSFFSSANTLLPFVARDILHVGPVPYGWMSAAQSIGTLIIAVYLSQKSNLRRQGALIAVSVAGFGLATVLFGVSTSFWLTMLALILIGFFDGLSTIIRNTVRQLLTPDAMRGRMMSITQIFFKGGPQLGEMEAGLMAQAFSVPFAIISGGVGCVIASWVVVKKFPQLWNYDGAEEALPSEQTLMP
jgi:MFS family permease